MPRWGLRNHHGRRKESIEGGRRRRPLGYAQSLDELAPLHPRRISNVVSHPCCRVLAAVAEEARTLVANCPVAKRTVPCRVGRVLAIRTDAPARCRMTDRSEGSSWQVAHSTDASHVGVSGLTNEGSVARVQVVESVGRRSIAGHRAPTADPGLLARAWSRRRGRGNRARKLDLLRRLATSGA